MGNLGRFSSRRYKVLAAALSGSAIIVCIPLIFAAQITIASWSNPETGIYWTTSWVFAALALCLYNAIFGIVYLHAPNERALQVMAAAALLIILTCPLLWVIIP